MLIAMSAQDSKTVQLHGKREGGTVYYVIALMRAAMDAMKR